MEAAAVCKSLGAVRPYQLRSGFPLWGKSDHLPLSFLERGNGRKCLSFFDMWKFQDMDWRLTYIF